jgi:hypothetical protein
MLEAETELMVAFSVDKLLIVGGAEFTIIPSTLTFEFDQLLRLSIIQADT